MAEHTSNINLSKPTYSEDADIAVINSNMDIIDGKMGAVGNTSVQAQLNTASTNITNLGKELCAVVAGKQSTTGAATGEYVIVRGSTISGISDGAYIAAKTIPANTNLDSSYFSSTGMTKGIANALNSNLKIHENQKEWSSSVTLSDICTYAENLVSEKSGTYYIGYTNTTASVAIGLPSGAYFVIFNKHNNDRMALEFINIENGIRCHVSKVNSWSSNIVVMNSDINVQNMGSGKDLNNYTSNGWYRFTGSLSNSPSGNYGMMFVQSYMSGTDMMGRQMWFPEGSDALYVRRIYNNAFQNWQSVSITSA